MGLICSKAKRLPPVINKNLSTPKLPQLKTPINPDVSKVNTDTKTIASPKQPIEKTTANIAKTAADVAKTAAGVVLGNVVSQKFMKYDNKNYREDVKNAAESPTETNYSNENELENKEITGKDNNDLNEEEDELTDHDHNDTFEEDDD